MSLDLTTDYLALDFPEAVTYRSVATAGNTDQAVTKAFQYPVTDKERSPSNGVYQAFEKIWQIPGALVTPLVPKPRDVVLDSGSTAWTVQLVSYSAATQAWNLTCLNLVLALDLRDLITIQRATLEEEATAAKKKTWETLYADLAARMQKIEDQEEDYLDARGMKGQYLVYLSQAVSVESSTDRILFDGRYYDIRSYRNPDRIDELPVIVAELVP